MLTLSRTIEEITVFGVDCDCDVDFEIATDESGLYLECPKITGITIYNIDGSAVPIETIGHTYEEAVAALEDTVSEWFTENDEDLQFLAAEQLEEERQAAEDAYWDAKIDERREGEGTLWG